jgi:glycosyltransferase involved in cell wall biosynthesis
VHKKIIAVPTDRIGDDSIINPPRVLIGCPVRNREWILPRYLQSLLELDYPRDCIEYGFIVNDSTDNTLNILQEFARSSISPVHITIKNMGNRRPSSRGAYNIGNLAILRNIMLHIFLGSKCSHLFSVDSDILVTPGCLKELLRLNLPIVSLLVRNDHHLGDPGYYNISQLQGGHYRPVQDFPRGRVIPVDCTGAAYLVQRGVIEMGVRYYPHRQGEDVGFCEDARGKGISIWCHTGLEGNHVMIGAGCSKET